jgi:hypothetical protein
MNNLYYDYIGAKGNYEINDYIDTEIKITSNILDTKINTTSNFLRGYTDTNINTTSNFLRGYTDTNITNLDNYYNKIVNIKNVNNWLGNNTNTNHTYITNSNFTDAYSEIRFLSVNSINYPNQPNTNMIFPTYFSPPTYHKVKIGNDGKLYVFYQFDASINATLPSMWIDVNQEYGKIVADAVNKGFVIAQLELSVAYCLDNIVSGNVAGAGSLGYSMVDDPRNIATASTATPSLLLNIWNTFKASSSVAGLALAGVAGGLALYVPIYGIFSGINYNSYFNQVLANMNKNKQSNLDIGNIQTANDIQLNMNYTCNLIYENVVETSKYFSNLSINLGFINSNITTPQLIPNINTGNITYQGQELSTTLNNYLQKAGGTMSGRLNFNYGTGIFGSPSLGGQGNGERINLNTNGITGSDYPPSIGVSTNSLWFSSPNNHKYQWYINGIERMTLSSSGVLNAPSILENNQSIPSITQTTILNSTPNVSKKYMIQFTCSTPFLMPNGITYYKYDIDLRNYTQTKIINNPSSPYRIFKIRLWIASGYYEYLYNGNYNVLSYEVFMSNQSQGGGGGIGSAGINLRAIGTPENPILNGITPTQISLVRSADFNFICCLSIANNTLVYAIIEDCLF